MFSEELRANLFGVFFGLFLIMGLSGGLYIQFSGNAPLKRKLIPWVHVVSGALFVSSVAALHPLLLLLALPPCALITIINIVHTKVCGGCGKSNSTYRSGRKHCGGCGRKLK